MEVGIISLSDLTADPHNGIEARIRDLIDSRLDAIRTDMTAHQLRLQRVLPQLQEEFGGQRESSEIRGCADAVLREYQDAPVRSCVMSLAHRRTHECLRRDVCDLLTA